MARLSLTKAVEAYLQLVAEHPEKEPRTQRAQRDNQMMIIGFTKGQETLRQVLEQTGHKQLAATRADGQQQPMKVGDTNLWIRVVSAPGGQIEFVRMAAIEAERDAGVVRGMLDEGKTPEQIGEQLTTIRKYRDSADPDSDQAINHPRFPQ